MHKWLSDILILQPKGEHIWSAAELAVLDKDRWLDQNWDSEWKHTLDNKVRMNLCLEALANEGPILEIGVGAGGGNVSPLLHLDAQRKLIINDIDPRITMRWDNFLRSKLPSCNVAPCSFDASIMPLSTSSIASVSSRGGISNCRADSSRVLSECARVLRPGGKLVLYEMCISQDTLSQMPQTLRTSLVLNSWALGDWRQLLEAQGFTVVYDAVSEKKILEKDESALAYDASSYGVTMEVEWRGMVALI